MLRMLKNRLFGHKKEGKAEPVAAERDQFEAGDLISVYNAVRADHAITTHLATLITHKDFRGIPQWLIHEAYEEKGKGLAAAALLGCWAFPEDRYRVRLLAQCVRDGRLSTSGQSRLERDLNHLDMALRIRGLDMNLQGLKGMIHSVQGTAGIVDRMLSEYR